MRLAQESLAGRVAIIHTSSLSQSELFSEGISEPLSFDIDQISKRMAHKKACSSLEMFERIWQGSMPGYRSGRYKDREVFYSSYIQSYINRDVTDMILGVDKLLFVDFIRALACRTSQMLNISDISKDVGISSDTVKRWLQALEKSGIIFFLRPYSNNLLKRTIKTPKMYFFDTGLVAYLLSYSSPEILMNGQINGAILENYTVSEIRKTWHNNARECLLYYYRDKDSVEIDLILETDGAVHPIEIKKTTNPSSQLVSSFRVLDKGSVPRGTGMILCLAQNFSAIDRNTLIVPIWMI